MKKINEGSKEVIEKNFLQEEQELPNTTVHVYKEVPQTAKGIFINNRDPGVALMFHYSSKTHPLHHYTLYHGQECELPLEVINHLEGMNSFDPWSCHRRMYGKRTLPDGSSEIFENGYQSYFQFKRKAA